MIVSACLHRSVIDSPNPKHSPLSTSYDGTLDWNHSGWGEVWAICYLLPARFAPPPQTPPPTLHPPPLTPATRIFATGAHYGNQTVCVYRNQSKKPESYDTAKSVCNFWLMRGSALFFWVGGTTCRTSGIRMDAFHCFWTSESEPEPLVRCVLRVAPNMANKGLTHFLDNIWLHRGDECHIRYLSSALLPPWHCFSPRLSFPLPAISVPAWFIKLLWQFTLMLFPAT